MIDGIDDSDEQLNSEDEIFVEEISVFFVQRLLYGVNVRICVAHRLNAGLQKTVLLYL